VEAELVSVALETRLNDYLLALDFTVEDELLALVGPAGAGKSVVLRSVAGVFTPDGGRVAIHGRVVFQSSIGVNMPPGERRIGYVPQHFALFPHLDVAENVAFPLRRARQDTLPDPERRVSELLDLLGLTAMRRAAPGDLSAAERWRVALARALILDPDVLLLDDTFAELESGPRRQTRLEFATLRRRIRVPTVVATDDLEEACELADRIGVMDAGRLLQLDQPATLLARPATRRVARLVGSSNIIPGVISATWREGLAIDTELGPLRVASAPPGYGPGYAVDLVIRPDQVRFLAEHAQPAADDNIVYGTIVDEFTQNAVHALTVQPDDGELLLHVLVDDLAYQQCQLAVQQRRALSLPPKALHVVARG
jgi:ABC-type Fe3+/spermidine/putrescine transport system ATPase subunit